MTILKNFATAAAGLTFVLGAYAYVQTQDEKVRLEDEARFGSGVLMTNCTNLTPNDQQYHDMGCSPQ